MFAQSTNIAIGTNTLQPSVKRLGINLGTEDYWDSGQTTQNLLYQNPGFEGQIWNSTIRCQAGTPTSCQDDDQWSGWPAGFWNGATFEVFYGAAAGRTGTVSYSTAPGNGAGLTLNFTNAGVAPSNGDYLIVRKTVSGLAAGGWWPAASGNGAVTDNLTDLPPATLGKQTVALSAPAASDSASLTGYFDTVTGKTFLQLNGSYQLQFKAKGTGGSNRVSLLVSRSGVATYLTQTVSLSNGWNTYNIPFTANENGSAIGNAQVVFATVGADSFELDDVSLTQSNTDPTNTTAFRDPVVKALRLLQPGILRYWGGQLGDTLDNLITPQFGRQRAGYLAWFTESYQIDYGLHEFLGLSQAAGAEPWFVVPSTFSTTDASNLIEYLAGDASTPYGAKRAALGQTTPWTQVFSKIHLEFANEAWNSGFKGGSIEYSGPYASRAQTIFGVMRANPAYMAPSFDLVLGGQAVWAGRNSDIQNNCNNNDSFTIAPYTMGTVDSFADLESLYGSTFAEPEAMVSSTGTAEGDTPGEIYQDYQAIQGSSHPVPLSFYEVNLSTLGGSITQDALNSYTPSLGAGLMVADTMLLSLRQFGIVNQELFALPQYNFIRPDGQSALLWGSVVDMGVTDRKRPQFLALQLANAALSNGAGMLETIHTGSDPTWDQPLTNTVQLNGAHFLQSFAFANGTSRSAVIFNLSRSAALPVTFSDVNAPSGTVQMQQLTSANPSDTNEDAHVVSIVPATLSNFNPAAGLSLPPYSMTVLTWQTDGSSSTPVISAVTATAISATSAIITWTTDQAASSQVDYGTTTSYTSLSALNGNLATTHSVTLSGLTPGTQYNYAVVSANSSGNSATSANYTFATNSQPPVISSVTATSITATSATITWTTNQAASSLVNYGTTRSYSSSSGLSQSMVTSHSVTLTGLTPGTTYYYVAVSANSSSGSATSPNYSFATVPQGSVISAVMAINVSSTSALVTWTTDQPASSLVNYGATTAYNYASPLSATMLTKHAVTLSGLLPGTIYNYDVVSETSAGSWTDSPNFTFSTASAAPVISAVSAGSISATSATITWLTDQAASTQVTYGTTTSYGASSALNSTPVRSHSMTLTSLMPGTTYNYSALSANPAGNAAASGNLTFTTAATATEPPVISAVTSSNISGTSATITWTTDQPSSSSVAYGTSTAYSSVSPTNSSLVTSHSVTLSGLTPGTTYNYSASSVNSAGKSASSANFTLVTPASNATAPTVGYVAYWGITGAGITVSWSSDMPAASALAYGTSTSLGQLTPIDSTMTNSHGAVLTGLNPGTTYYFVAQCTAANGATGYSKMYSFTTLTTSAPLLSAVTAVPLAGNQAQISWTTSVPTLSYIQFGETTAYNRWSNVSVLTSNPNLTLGYVPSGIIHYQLVSVDSFGNKAVSPDDTFVEP